MDPNSDCSKFLEKQFGINGSRIARTVRGQRAFDGQASTISMQDAGLLRPGTVAIVEGVITRSTDSVSKFFEWRVASAQAGDARASTGATANDVYYLPLVFFEEQILHEALHTFLGSSGSEDKIDAQVLSNGGCNSSGKANANKN